MSKSRAKKIRVVPEHVALIPDGNRRWSSLHKLAIFNGYEIGVNKFIQFSEWAKSFGVKTITVWALSTENIRSRSRAELETLYSLYIKAAKDPAMLQRLVDNGARIRVIGNLKLLPRKVVRALKVIEVKSGACKNLTINLLIGYGGRDDILHAVKGLYKRLLMHSLKGQITESMLAAQMRTASVPDVDLIIRTSGEKRLSGLLPMQSDYSELYFAKKYWPDFNRRDLERALKVFSERQRRFGR